MIVRVTVVFKDDKKEIFENCNDYAGINGDFTWLYFPNRRIAISSSGIDRIEQQCIEY